MNYIYKEHTCTHPPKPFLSICYVLCTLGLERSRWAPRCHDRAMQYPLGCPGISELLLGRERGWGKREAGRKASKNIQVPSEYF